MHRRANRENQARYGLEAIKNDDLIGLCGIYMTLIMNLLWCMVYGHHEIYEVFCENMHEVIQEMCISAARDFVHSFKTDMGGQSNFKTHGQQ